jgi:hypothetical protein
VNAKPLEHEYEEQKQGAGETVTDITFTTIKEEHFTALKFNRQRPLVLLVKLDWRLGTAMLSIQSQVMISGFL